MQREEPGNKRWMDWCRDVKKKIQIKKHSYFWKHDSIMGNLPGFEASLVCRLFFLVSRSVFLHSSFSLGPRQKDST